MEDIRSILSLYRSRQKSAGADEQLHTPPMEATVSEIPDLFFDEILIHNKLTRSEILVLMYLYRQVWCKPNLYRSHGIGPLQSYQQICHSLNLAQDDLIQTIRSLESYGFIQTIRSGQYFVRKFFTEENDARYGQQYDF